MVFESLIVDLINRYLGSYVETLNASQLKIGLLSGNAKLENVDIKANAFDDFNLPVKVLQGHIGSLTLKIPFKNLYTEPTIAELDGLYVLVVPNAAVKYDETKEKQYAREAKRKELRAIEEARTMQSKSEKKEESTGDSFGEKLAAQIVKNLQIDIRNIHIRYEDSHSIPGQIFSLGITLSGLTFQTCDPDKKPLLIRDESIREFYKYVNLTSLGIYWNHDSAVFSDKARGPLRVAMRTTISSPENPKSGFNYLLNPISSTAMLHVHMRPEETDFTVPQLNLSVDFSEIDLSLSLHQYHDVTSFLDATDRMITQNKYRKYRPGVPLRGNYSTWWKYAYISILEEFIRRRRKMWSWDHIKNHRQTSREYIILWTKQLRGEKMNQEQQKMLDACEDNLDVFNIVLCRQQAELQHNQSKAKRTAARSGGGGFFSWFSRSSSTDSSSSSRAGDSTASVAPAGADTTDLVQRLQSEMTREEKARLYAAINYSETGVSAGKFPTTYVSSIINLTLRQLSFTLVDDELSDPRILKLAVNKLTADVKQRAGDQALSVKLRLDSLEALGARPSWKLSDLTKSSTIPVLITSHVVASTPTTTPSNETASLLSVDFEKNPLDRRADQSIRVRADPLQFVYDAETINKIVHFLAPPKDIRLQELSSTVLSSLEDVKEVTISGLRHLASRRAYTEVLVDVKPSYFILPDTGVFRNNCRLLLIDLGSLTVRSMQNKPTQSNRSERKDLVPVDKASMATSDPGSQHIRKVLRATFEELKEGAYDKYEVVVSSVQVIMVEQGEDWRVLRTKDQSPSHILRPLGIHLNLKRCLLHNDVNLPKLLVDGCLPVFRVDLTDQVLKSLFELVSNVPFPEPDKRLTTPENPTEVLKDAIILQADRAAATRDVLRAARHLDRQQSDSTAGSWFSESLDDVDEEDEEEEEFDEDDADDLSDERAKAVGVDGSVASAEQDDVRVRANKNIRRQQRELALQRRRRANLIDFKVEFVIRTIQVQILKRELAARSIGSEEEDTAILNFTVQEVGTNIMKRRWDQELHAHIGTLSIAVPHYVDSRTKEPVCLAKTRRHVEGHHLLALHLLVAEKNAPDFESRYNNTRHHLRCEFKALELCVHQEATLLLIDFFNHLLRDLTLPTKPVETASQADPYSAVPAQIRWATKVGDKQGLTMAQARAESEASSAKQLPDHVTAARAIEGHIARKYERRNIRLEAASAAVKSENLLQDGKTVIIRELNITQWLVNATLDKVKLTLCSDSMTVLSTKVHGLRLDVRTTYGTLELSAILSELSLTDQIESTDYRKILWVDPAESIVALQLTHYVQGTNLPENLHDPDKVDMSLSLQLGKLHLVFLYHFVMRVVNFMNAFQQATQAMLNKVHELSDAAVQQVQQAVSRPPKFRLGLNITAQAPVVYIPQHSFSTKALMIDFGRVTFSNRFELVTATNPPPDASSPIPAPGIILEHTEIRLDNLRLSRAVLSDITIQSEKPVVQPNDIVIRMRRNMNPDSYTDLPLLTVNGGLASIHIAVCQGDYRVIQEVLLDNFAEIPPPVARQAGPITSLSSVTSADSSLTEHDVVIHTPNPPLSGSAPDTMDSVLTDRQAPSEKPADAVPVAVRFNLEMGAVTLELYSGEHSVSDWKEQIPADLQLALCTLNRLRVTGQAGLSGASEIELRLHNIELTDTRPGANKKITKILDRAIAVDEPEELIYVKYTQTENRDQKAAINLRSIHLCASMDYLLALADFHLKSAPVLEKKIVPLTPITESGKLKRRGDPTHSKPQRRPLTTAPTKYPNNIVVQVDVGEPELVIVEDIYNLNSNSIKLTAAFHMQYTMTEDVVVVDAAVQNLIMVACPYKESISGKFSKEIISPTEVHYYSKQPINGSLQGSLHLDTLLININPGTIQLLSHIASSMQAATVAAKAEDSSIADTGRKSSGGQRLSKHRKHLRDDYSFWDPVPLEELNLPYLRESDNSDRESPEGPVPPGCDVSKVLEQMEERRVDQDSKDIIVLRLQTLRVVLESQVGTRSMPMLVLESSMDGEMISPNTCPELKVTLDVSLSYYNDALNQWEQILETLPDDGDRMWSIQFEFSTTNIDELLAEEDLEEVGCLQTSTHTVLLVSRDNLELTLSKSALDMLNNLGRSFEAAYKQQLIDTDYESGGQLAAPYRIQNRTGWPLVIRLDSPLLQAIDTGDQNQTCRVRKQFTSSVRKQLTLSTPATGTLRDTDESHATTSDVQDSAPSGRLLKPDEEIGYWEPARMCQKTLTLRTMTDRAPHYTVWLGWSDAIDAKEIKHSEALLSLNSSGNTMLQLRKPVPASAKISNSKGFVPYPVVAQVSTYLGMRVISLRSTVQVVNDTTETLCIYSRVAPSSQDNRPGLLASLDPGEIYPLPVGVVNSSQYTGIYIQPQLDTTAMSDIPVYWPEIACAPSVASSSHDLTYLAPLADRVNSSAGIEAQTLQTIEKKVTEQQQQQRTTGKPRFDWPVQLIQCPANSSKTTYYYNVITLTGAYSTGSFGSMGDVSAQLQQQQQLSASGASSRDTGENDFLMVIRNAIVLHNQLPIAINYVVKDVFGEIEAGGHCTLRTVRPKKSSIDIWFDYDNRVYRGKLEVCSTMEELTVCTFESREGYELLTLHLGLRNAASMGQTALTLYAPYWMINKTGKDLVYKAVDDSEVVHPASFQGALLYSSLAKSVFGKRKTRNSNSATYHTSSEEDTDDAVEPGQSTLSLNSHGAESVTTTRSETKSWWRWGRTPQATTQSPKISRSRRTSKKPGPKLQFANKNKASLRVDDSQWSDKFSLDTVGSSGRVICRTKQKTSFEIGVKIDLSSSGLTKIVTLMPYLMIVNKANIDLECSEAELPGDAPSIMGNTHEWIHVPAGEAVPFWPQATTSKKMLLRCRVNEGLVTDAFPYYESHSILMKLPGKYIGVFVEVETTEEATVIILQLYQEGMALVRLVNHLGDCQPVFFQQRGVDQVHKLEAGMSVMYAWDCARSERELVFYCDEKDRHQSNRLTTDCVEEFYVNDTKAYWVSFLWNMQRVLLFTQDLNAAKNARLSADLETIEQEIIISLQSIGLSLVDNLNRVELAYLSVTSSGVRWSQVKRGNRLKPLKAAVSESLERAYTDYANQLRAGEPAHGLAKLTDVGRPIEVDFNQMMMIQPDQCELRRAFEPGVFLQYKTSPSQMQVHGKIFRVQLDNQKMDCTFPVVLAPYPQPKSVAFDSGPKPLVELSAIVARTADPGSFRFKYFRVLVQEMQLRLDQGFLTDVVYFFGTNVSRVPEQEAFKRDYQLIENRLIDSPVVVSHLQEGNRSVFDNLHISPIKMHMSFSLTGSTEGKSNAFPSEVLNLFLQSLGVVLTDVQDVIFKLAYFERQACIMTVNQMMAEMTRHYVSQGIRQMYVLVLGLDVLGNPFGVLRGMAQGVEDLFYEPVKGAVLGPEEFAEGVALGVKSLFGHAVGGAAGAVSRITGTIGKGVAALTLDEDYKRRRREQLSHRPENFGAGLVQGGKGLVMGFLNGVTGVLTKPVEGARKEGVEGFFKGVGKGLVGAVTRPVSGVVDFASSSFEGIRRFADTVEEVGRVRPPRYLRLDGVIRPYERREAEGHLILRQLDKNDTYGHYVYHVVASRGNHVILLTTSDLLFVDCMDLLGTWSISWQTRLDALDGVPVVNRAGILITLKEKQRKMFQAGQKTKQFDCAPDAAMTMVHQIDVALSKIEGQPPTIQSP